MTNTMNMLPNDHHPGPRCSCAECQRRYPEVSEPAQPTSKDQISAERLSDLIASCIFQSETGGHGDGYVAFLYDIACACMELQRRRASLEPCAECQRMREGLQLMATDEHRLMNITARQTAQLILNGKPSGIAAQPPSDADLRAALVHAVSVIQTWHNMEIPERSRSGLWDTYWKNAPEMKQIRTALTKESAP